MLKKASKQKFKFDRQMLLKIFLVLLLVCVYIVATKIANDKGKEPVKPEPQSYVVEVQDDADSVREKKVRVHRIDVQEYDYWFHTDKEYNVGDRIIE